MNLINKFQSDINTALKAGDKEKVSILRFIRSALLSAQKATKDEFTDDMAIQVLAKEVKKRKDAIVEFGFRSQEYKEGLEKEIEILEPYLPKQLSEDEIRGIAEKIIEKENIKDIKGLGIVMKIIKPMVNGMADGKMVSNIVKGLLS